MGGHGLLRMVLLMKEGASQFELTLCALNARINIARLREFTSWKDAEDEAAFDRVMELLEDQQSAHVLDVFNL